jgi:hypothetical protein
VTIDCTKLDHRETPYSPALVFVGGTSASTSEAFTVFLPDSAVALRDPSALGDYPVLDARGQYGVDTAPQAFAISMSVFDTPAPYPNPNQKWDSCAAAECGLPDPDPSHYSRITSITEQPASTPGMATFRVSGTFTALVQPIGGSATAPTTATGDWSLIVDVNDPGGAPPDAGAD